jgi:uncharacterized Zn-finger protein
MIQANWRIQCNVECPYCERYIDLVSEVQDSFEWLPWPGHSEDIEVEITCPKCNSDFTVQRVEY